MTRSADPNHHDQAPHQRNPPAAKPSLRDERLNIKLC